MKGVKTKNTDDKSIKNDLSKEKEESSDKLVLDMDDIVESKDKKWKILSVFDSGGFGDVYKVSDINDPTKKEYSLKTERIQADKRKSRLKVEVKVLISMNGLKQDKKKHFLALIDRGINSKFKFYVMDLVGPSLEDVRREILKKPFSKPTCLYLGIETLEAISNLHSIGFRHRNIKPHNFSIGLEEKEKSIYMMDFGIARKYWDTDTKKVKVARVRVKFMGTVRFASRRAHEKDEQSRKDDLEGWLYMLYDLYDQVDGLPWINTPALQMANIFEQKEQFFQHKFPKVYTNIPVGLKKLLEYVDDLSYSAAPDYELMKTLLVDAATVSGVKSATKPDWIGIKNPEKPVTVKKTNENVKKEPTIYTCTTDIRMTSKESTGSTGSAETGGSTTPIVTSSPITKGKTKGKKKAAAADDSESE